MSIGPGKKLAIQEALNAATVFVPERDRGEFVAIGGAALMALGNTRDVPDLDIAVSKETLYSFSENAKNSKGTFKNEGGDWYYYCKAPSTSGITIKLEFVLIGDEFVPGLGSIYPMGDGYRADLGSLAVMKASKYLNMDDEKDLNDFRFILNKMDATKEAFEYCHFMNDEYRKELRTCASATGQSAILQKYLK